jgi:hypothetical protein
MNKKMEINNLQFSKRIYCIFALFAFSLLTMPGCKKVDLDTQPPKIILIQPNDLDSFAVGSDFLVVTVMHDYQELASYKYNLYWFEDPSNVSVNPDDPAFEIEESASIEPEDSAPHWEDVNFRIEIPLGIRQGYYILELYCYDKSDNFDKVAIKLLFHN